MSPEVPYGPIRGGGGGGRVPTAPQTAIEPIVADTDALIVALTRALAATMPDTERRIEQKVALRIETAQKAAESAELTMAKRRAEKAEDEASKWIKRAKSLGITLGFVLVTYTTALAVYRDAVGTAEPVAQETAASTATVIAETKVLPLDVRVDVP